MKMGKLLSLAALVMIGLMTVVACGSDDDDNGGNGGNGGNGKLDNPEYADVAAFYEITSPNSDIKSIELTEAGRYVIIQNTYNYTYKSRDAKAKMPKGHFLGMASKALTRGSYANIIEGKYTKKGNGSFELEGYGTLTITGTSSDAQSIEITLANGTKMPTLTAERKNQQPSSSATATLCRTWKLASLRVILTLAGKSIYDKEYKIDEIYKFGKDMMDLEKKYYPGELDEEDDLEYYESEWREQMEDMPATVTFTKAGTYLVTYNNGELAVSTWSWEDVKTGKLRYSWNYDSMSDRNLAGTALVSYRGKQLAVQEDLNDQDVDDDYYDYDEDEFDFDAGTTMITYCDEVK